MVIIIDKNRLRHHAFETVDPPEQRQMGDSYLVKKGDYLLDYDSLLAGHPLVYVVLKSTADRNSPSRKPKNGTHPKIHVLDSNGIQDDKFYFDIADRIPNALKWLRPLETESPIKK
jgi:hypothetical protein